MFSKNSLAFLLSPIIALSCSTGRNQAREPLPETAAVTAYTSPAELPPGKPNTEYHFDDYIHPASEGDTQPVEPFEKVKFYEKDNDRVNVLEIEYPPGHKSRFTDLDDDLQVDLFEELNSSDESSVKQLRIEPNTAAAERIQERFSSYLEKIKQEKAHIAQKTVELPQRKPWEEYLFDGQILPGENSDKRFHGSEHVKFYEEDPNGKHILEVTDITSKGIRYILDDDLHVISVSNMLPGVTQEWDMDLNSPDTEKREAAERNQYNIDAYLQKIKVAKSIQEKKQAEEPADRPPGKPNAEYHFEGIVYMKLPDGHSYHTIVRFFEDDEDRINVLEVEYPPMSGEGTRYVDADDDLIVDGVENLLDGQTEEMTREAQKAFDFILAEISERNDKYTPPQDQPTQTGKSHAEYHINGVMLGRIYPSMDALSNELKEKGVALRCPPDRIFFTEERNGWSNVLTVVKYGPGTEEFRDEDDDLLVDVFIVTHSENNRVVRITDKNRGTEKVQKIQKDFDRYLEMIRKSKEGNQTPDDGDTEQENE